MLPVRLYFKKLEGFKLTFRAIMEVYLIIHLRADMSRVNIGEKSGGETKSGGIETFESNYLLLNFNHLNDSWLKACKKWLL